MLFFLFNGPVRAQYYSKTYSLYAGTNGYISSIQVVADTIYAMCYVGDSLNPTNSIAALEKFDKYGNRISYSPLSIPNCTNIGVNMTTLIRTNDGGFAYGGYTQDTSQTQNAILIIKYDSYGNFQWYKQIPDTNYSYFICEAFMQDSFSNYYLTGSFTTGQNSKNNIYIAKTNSLGNLIYKKEFVNSNAIN